MSRWSPSRLQRPLLLFASLGISTACATAGRPTAGDARSDVRCFDVSSLDPALQRLADRVLLEASDGEALYTLAGGLKPLSSGRSFAYEIAPVLNRAAVDSLEQLRRVTLALSCGDIGAFVHVFTATSDGASGNTRRTAEVVVYHRESVKRAVVRQANFFATLGVTPSTEVRSVLAAVENAPRADRWRGYGLLYGYPDRAVDFFVRAGIEGDSTKQIVPRDFLRIETFRKFPDTRDGPPVLSSFVYAVPKGATTDEADAALQRAAAPIYARYARAREATVRADSTGAVQLWRAWLLSGAR